MQKLTHEIYSFDEFRLDLTRGSIFRGFDELKLRPKSFEVLKYLAQNQGRLVSKDELIDFVWQGMAVTDDSLVQCLKDIRRTLGDEAQHFIKTVPRRGYIFDKEIHQAGAPILTEDTTSIHVVIEGFEETIGHSASDETALAGSRSNVLSAAIKGHWVAAAAGTALAGVLIIAGVFLYKPLIAWYFRPPSIAVLPIVNATGNADLEYLSDGLTDSIIHSLKNLNEDGKPPRLRVMALATVSVFKDKNIEPQEIGTRLRVDTVLSSKMSDDNGLRTFKFELINVEDGSIRWSKQYSVLINRPIELLEKQNEIPSDVIAQLPLRLSDPDRQSLTRRYTQNAEAYDAYLKGRANNAKITPSSLRRSIEDFEKALKLDPNFALAYWAMGMSYRNQGLIDELPDKEADEKALDLFQKALKIDNTLTVAKDAMRSNEAATGNWEAIKVAGDSHPGYGEYLTASGRIDELIDDQNKRLSTNPYVPILNFNHCQTLAFARRYSEAIPQCQKTLNLVPEVGKGNFGPDSPWVHLILANIYTEQGAFDNGIAEGKMAMEMAENSEAMRAMLGYFYAKAGRRDEALKIVDQLNEQIEKGEYVPPLNLAWLYSSLGDNDKAFFWLDRAFDERETKLTSINFAPTWDALRSDPRFPSFVRRLNLPD